MKLFTALLDIALIPVAVAKDIITAPVKIVDPYNDHPLIEATRNHIEKVDKDLEDK